MRVSERVVIGVGVLLHPFAEREGTLRSLRHLGDVVDWVLPDRAEVLVDLTGANLGDDLAWWTEHDELVGMLQSEHRHSEATRVRCAWLVAPDHAQVSTHNADRIREVVVQLDEPLDWGALELMLREYAAMVDVHDGD